MFESEYIRDTMAAAQRAEASRAAADRRRAAQARPPDENTPATPVMAVPTAAAFWRRLRRSGGGRPRAALASHELLTAEH